MIESRRVAYLEAMGFDVWSAKPAAPEAGRLLFGPGDGNTLLVLDSADARVNPFALDIARLLGGAVWAWLDSDPGSDAITLDEAVGQRLFTRVVLFGSGLSRLLCQGEAPLVIGSARILVTPDLETLALDGSAKLTFWKQLSGITTN